MPYKHLDEADVQILQEAVEVLDSTASTTLAGMAADALREVLDEIDAP
jgi:hypothetical protein